MIVRTRSNLLILSQFLLSDGKLPCFEAVEAARARNHLPAIRRSKDGSLTALPALKAPRA